MTKSKIKSWKDNFDELVSGDYEPLRSDEFEFTSSDSN